MPTYIYILKLQGDFNDLSKWKSDTEQIIGNHFNYLKKLCEQGIVLFVGRTQVEIGDERNTGICVFQAKNEVEATEIMNNDPAVKQGIMKAELSPFNIALNAFTKAS